MPYASDAQRKYFNANRKKLEAQGVDVDEWNQASKGLSLPEHSMGWMQRESKREKKAGTKGIFSSAAKRAGKSTRQFAEEHKHSSGKIGRRARMALAFMGARH